jgi:hypothetical protein
MKKVLALCAALMLSGCASFTFNPKPPPVQTVVVAPTPPVIPPVADQLNLAPVHWTVYNSSELKDLSDKLTASGGNVVLFTLDDTNFKHLSDNLSDIKKFIGQQNAIILFLNKAANAPADAAKASAEKK